jgi:hypothetical protein
MPPYDQRDDIAQLLAEQRNLAGNPLASGIAGLGAGYGTASPMTGPQLAGLPQTPAGGVPGAGIGPAGPSSLALPPQRGGVQGAMPTMGSLGAGMGGMGTPRMPAPTPPMPMQQPPALGTGQMSDFENPSLGRMKKGRTY